MEKNLCAITGLGLRTSHANSGQDLWNLALLSPPALTKAELFDPRMLPYPFFAIQDEIFSGQKRSHSAKDTLELATLAANSALTQANFTAIPARLGVFIGTTSGSALHFFEAYAKNKFKDDQQNPPSWLYGLEQEALRQETIGKDALSDHDLEDYFNCNLATNLGKALKAQGPLLTISNACTSGADALGLALMAIRDGICDVALAGGAETISLISHTGFARLMIASDLPCKPFDANRTGLNLGEGAGIMVLENIRFAQKRSAKILGYLAGYGAAVDGYHPTAPEPNALGLSLAVKQALEQAEISPSDLAFINAHATATKENDLVEGLYLAKVFPDTPIWASKALTGHTLGAAGAIEAILTLLALEAKIVPPSHNFTTKDPAIGLTPTQEPTKINSPYAMSTSLGFGGSNAALILKANP